MPARFRTAPLAKLTPFLEYHVPDNRDMMARNNYQSYYSLDRGRPTISLVSSCLVRACRPVKNSLPFRVLSQYHWGLSVAAVCRSGLAFHRWLLRSRTQLLRPISSASSRGCPGLPKSSIKPCLEAKETLGKRVLSRRGHD